LIGAGLGSGQPAYWSAVHAAGGLRDAAGFALHPYGKGATDARMLLQAHQRLTPSLPCWVTEWNRPPAEIPQFAAMLRQYSVLAMWFCWSPAVAQHGEIGRA